MSDLKDYINPATMIHGGQQEVVAASKPTPLPTQRPAPVPDDLERMRARQRESQRKYGKSGRAGTILTSDDSKLG